MKKLLFAFALAVGIFSTAQEAVLYDYGILVATDYAVGPLTLEWNNGETTEEKTFNRSELKELSKQNQVIKKIEELEQKGWSLFHSDMAMTPMNEAGNAQNRLITSYILRRKK